MSLLTAQGHNSGLQHVATFPSVTVGAVLSTERDTDAEPVLPALSPWVATIV